MNKLLTCWMLAGLTGLVALMAGAVVPPAYRYANAGYGFKGYIAQRNAGGALSCPFVTATPQLFADDATLEELASAEFTGYIKGASISNPKFLTAARVVPYYSKTDRLQGVLVAFQTTSDGGWHKAVILRFTRGTGGVYVQVDRTCYTSSSKTYSTDMFFTVDYYGNVTLKSGINAGGIATSATAGGYGICALQAQTWVPTTGSMRAFANGLGQPVLTVDNLATNYTFTAIIQGGSVNKNNGANSRAALVATATNVHIKRNAETAVAEQIIVELPIRNDSGKFIKCPIVSLTNGVDGVYASIHAIRYTGGSDGVGFKFVNDDGTFNGSSSSAAASLDAVGYGVTGLAATYDGTAQTEPTVRAVYGDRPLRTPNWANPHGPANAPVLSTTPQLVFPVTTLAEVASARIQAYGFGYQFGAGRTTLTNVFTEAHTDANGKTDFVLATFEAFDDVFVKGVVVKFTERTEGVYAEALAARYKRTASTEAGHVRFAQIEADGSVTLLENASIVTVSASVAGYGLYGLQLVNTLPVLRLQTVFARGADEAVLTLDDLDDYVISGSPIGSAFEALIGYDARPALNVKRWKDAETDQTTNLVYEVQVHDDNFVKCVIVSLRNGEDGVEGQVVTNLHALAANWTIGTSFVNYDGTYATNTLATTCPTALVYQPNYGLANLRAVPNDFVEVARWVGGTSADRTVAGNWRCRNVAGELPGRVPSADARIELEGFVKNFQVPAGETLPYAGLTVRSCVLQENCDWRGLGVLEVPYGETWTLNGKTLTAAAMSGWGTIDGAGTLTLDVAEGVTNRNATVALSDTVALVKSGAGTYVAAKAQTTTANVAVNAGTVVVENATGLGNLASATLTVAADAALEVAAPVTVQNFTLNGTGSGTSAVTVTGVYTPNGETQPPIILSGTAATVDLSARTTPWPAGGNTTFPSREITLTLGSRTIQPNTYLVTWDAPPADGTSFTTDNELANRLGVRFSSRGVYVNGGLIILIR